MKLCDSYDNVSHATGALNCAKVTMADLTMDMIMRSESGHAIPNDIAVRIGIIEDYLDDMVDLLSVAERNLLDLVQGDDDDDSTGKDSRHDDLNNYASHRG